MTILVRYTLWHYLVAPTLLYHIWCNFVWYVGHVFSVTKLWRSLFAPWKRVIAVRTKRWSLEDAAAAFVANLVSRLIGAIMRMALMTIGISIQLAMVLMGCVVYILWYLLPIILGVTVSHGITLIF